MKNYILFKNKTDSHRQQKDSRTKLNEQQLLVDGDFEYERC